jgi:hypothetical protein
MGIGTNSPSYLLDVQGGQINVSGGLCLATICKASWNDIASGSLNYLSKFTGATSIGNSQIYDNGTNVGIGTISPASKLTVTGVIESTTGGYKFPDGTSQKSAAPVGNGTLNYVVKFTAAASVGNSSIFDNGSGVGIGTASVSGAKLKVAGVIESTTGGYKFPDGTSQTTAAASGSKFGGDGSDGALSISSGTTTIDLGGLSIVVKNYTSISITGTGNLAFSNPNPEGTLIVLRSQGAVTITSSATRAIDLRNIGGAGGTGGAAGGSSNPGSDGIDSTKIIDVLSHFGAGAGVGNSPGSGGNQITQASSLYSNLAVNIIGTRTTLLVPGSGGGGGSSGVADGGTAGAGGNGGRGGGSMIIESAGAYNVTGTIDVSGSNGSNGGNGGPGNGSGGGGGGGGAGGMFLAMYNSLTADSGTYTVAAGSGGSVGTTASGTHGGGGGGAGSTEGAGTAGAGNGSGGTGSAGIAVSVINTVF